jgi:hypothetical protein
MQAFIRATTVVVAQGAIVAATMAGCDGADRVEATRPAAHQQALAEEHEWSAHLLGQARTHLSSGLDQIPPPGTEAAETLERTARLVGQARTHRSADSHVDTAASTDDTATDEFVPGSGRMPTR